MGHFARWEIRILSACVMFQNATTPNRLSGTSKLKPRAGHYSIDHEDYVSGRSLTGKLVIICLITCLQVR